MTGPGPGKIFLSAEIEIVIGSNTIVVDDAELYLHVKGWSRAFVTHLDIESSRMNEFIARPRYGFYAKAIYRPIGLVIIAEKALKPCILRIREDVLLPKVFSQGDETWCFVGGKYGGIFIGFRKRYIERMEFLAEKLWGIKPIKRSR